MHRQDLGLAVVEAEENGVFAHSVKQPVFSSVHGSWADNGGIGEGVTDSTLTGVLCAVEFR